MSTFQLTLHHNDIRTLSTILRPYIVYIRTNHLPSYGRGLLILTTENLSQRLNRLVHGSDNQAIFLSSMEIQIIDQALDVFLRALPTLVKQSQERDATLEACKNLKAFILKHTSPQ